jgi:hypothetical protein
MERGEDKRLVEILIVRQAAQKELPGTEEQAMGMTLEEPPLSLASGPA